MNRDDMVNCVSLSDEEKLDSFTGLCEIASYRFAIGCNVKFYFCQFKILKF